jgi:hypothetical protein
MNKNEKELQNTIFLLGFIIIITVLFLGDVIKDNRQLREENTIILFNDSTLRDSMYNTNQVNLILRDKITGKDEKGLKNNNRYMELVTP